MARLAITATFRATLWWLKGEIGTERQHGRYGACRSRVCCWSGAARPTRLRRGRKVVSVVPPAPAPAIAATAAAPSPAPSATSAHPVDAVADDSTPGMALGPGSDGVRSLMGDMLAALRAPVLSGSHIILYTF